MDANDAKLAFVRHATSKIITERDLFRIKTMGFRGEALPSIAAVSKVVMETSTGADSGTRIVIENNDIISIEPCASKKGTMIKVEELFYNTPARLKYLKADSTEYYNFLMSLLNYL
jgi:DNA mismatch repair protein MutL